LANAVSAETGLEFTQGFIAERRVQARGVIDGFDEGADTLAFTIDQMGRIDEAYLAAFPDRG
jgi:hypothetical protein